jgi:riboflavin kinase/FMN adenylyltransferase
MHLFRHHTSLPDDARGAVVALGNFDGVHRGHQTVIGRAGDDARRLGAPLGVVTFEPHPRQYFRPDDPPFRLTPFRVKTHCIEAEGVDLLYCLHFDRDFSQLAPEQFFEEVLVAGLGIRHVVIGWDYVFGRARAGNAEVMQALAARRGVGVTIVQPFGLGDADSADPIVSATRIRDALVAGDPRAAALLLGRAWEIDGRVDHGDQRGRTIGFPTANIALGDYQRPRAGVYAVRVGIEGEGGVLWHDGVANIGTRPTVDGTDLRLEAYLFDFSGDLYGLHLRVALIDWIRPERKFASFADLQTQIRQDAEAARNLFAQSARP